MDDVTATLVLDVDRDRSLATACEVVDRERSADGGHLVDAYDVRSEIAEKHPAERSGTQATHHDDAHPPKGSGHCSPPASVRCDPEVACVVNAKFIPWPSWSRRRRRSCSSACA